MARNKPPPVGDAALTADSLAAWGDPGRVMLGPTLRCCLAAAPAAAALPLAALFPS